MLKTLFPHGTVFGQREMRMLAPPCGEFAVKISQV